MLAERFAETLCFSCATQSKQVESKLDKKTDKRIKETLSTGLVLSPSSFASTIVCPNTSQKHYKNLTRIVPKMKPKVFSVTYFLTPERKKMTFRTEIKEGKQRKHNHYTNALYISKRSKRIDQIPSDEPTFSSKSVIFTRN